MLYPYSRIKKNLERLCHENIIRDDVVGAFVGRCMYEFNMVDVPEEKDDMKAFFFYLAILKIINAKYETSILNFVYPDAVKYITNFDMYKSDFKFSELEYKLDIADNEDALIHSDYADVLAVLSH